MKIEKIFKILIVIIPLIILSLIYIIPSQKEFLIVNVSNVECDEIIKEGMRIETINNIAINSIEDFETIKKELKPNQTFFIIADGKIIRCKSLDEMIFEIKQVEKKHFYQIPNLERIVIEFSDKNKKIIDYLGYNSYIIDKNKIILPYDEKLIEMLSSTKDLKFYLEIDLEKENNTVKILDKEVEIDELYKIYDKVIIGEKNVTVIKYLFDQNYIEDFDFKIKYLYPLSISSVNISFRINETATKILKENLKNVPLRLIQLEKFYDAKLNIESKNTNIISNYLPYFPYERFLFLSLLNLENPKKIREVIALQLFDSKDLKIEKEFKIFSVEFILFIFFLVLFVSNILKIKSFNFIYFIPLIISSLIYPLIFSILLFLFLIFYIFIKKTIKYELIFISTFSFIIFLVFTQKVFLSIFSLLLTFSFLFLLEIFYKYFKKYEILILIILIIFSFLTFFLNSIISFSLLLPVFLKMLSRFFLYI